MTAEQYFQRYADRAGLTVEQLKAAHFTVIPCPCDEPTCEGWRLWKGNDPEYHHKHKPACVCRACAGRRKKAAECT